MSSKEGCATACAPDGVDVGPVGNGPARPHGAKHGDVRNGAGTDRGHARLPPGPIEDQARAARACRPGHDATGVGQVVPHSLRTTRVVRLQSEACAADRGDPRRCRRVRRGGLAGLLGDRGTALGRSVVTGRDGDRRAHDGGHAQQVFVELDNFGRSDLDLALSVGDGDGIRHLRALEHAREGIGEAEVGIGDLKQREALGPRQN